MINSIRTIAGLPSLEQVAIQKQNLENAYLESKQFLLSSSLEDLYYFIRTKEDTNQRYYDSLLFEITTYMNDLDLKEASLGDNLKITIDSENQPSIVLGNNH